MVCHFLSLRVKGALWPGRSYLHPAEEKAEDLKKKGREVCTARRCGAVLGCVAPGFTGRRGCDFPDFTRHYRKDKEQWEW